MKTRAAIAAELKAALLDMEPTPALTALAQGGAITKTDLVQFFRDALSASIDLAYTDFAERAGGVPSVRQVSVAAQSVLFGEMADSTLAAVQRVAAAEGWAPAKTATELRRAIRLTNKDAVALANYDAELKVGSSKAKRRALRDRRSDRSIRSDRPLSPAKRKLMVSRYRDRLARHYSSMVARAVAHEADQATQYAHWTDRLFAGDAEARLVRRFWENRGDGRVRHSHEQLPLDYPDGLPLTEAFVTEWGVLRYPRDSQAHARDRDGCRCKQRFSIVRKK